MGHITLSKAEAAKLAEQSVEEVGAAAKKAGFGSVFCLGPNGTKLYTFRCGAVVRYAIYGYTPGGRDVKDALALLGRV